LKDIYIYNARKEPIASFQTKYLERCYHIEKGTKNLDKKLLDEFEYMPKYMFLKWYKEDKQFKHRPKGGYPTSTLRKPYQYMVTMLCRIYGELGASHFPLSYMPLIYYCADEGFSFNWDDIVSTNLMVTITVVVEAQLGTFPSFYMSSYHLYITCISH
jgi:hypothetical protein